MNRAGVRPDEAVCFKGELRDADRQELRRCGFGFEHAVAKETAPKEDLVALTPCRRATTATEAPGLSDSSAI